MSAVQARVCDQFVEAMGPMIEREEDVARVFSLISYMRNERMRVVSDEEYDRLIPADKMMSDLRAMVHSFYQA